MLPLAPHTPPPPPPPHRRHTWRARERLVAIRTLATRKRIAFALLALAGALTIALLSSWWLAARTPSWWRSIDPRDPTTSARLATLADAVENGLLILLSQPRPAAATNAAPRDASTPPTWSITLDDQAASAWLISKLPRWALSQTSLTRWPDELDQVQVAFDDGSITLSARVVHPGGSRVLSASFRPRVDAQGWLWLEPGWVHLGSLPIPATFALSRWGRAVAPEPLPPELLELPDTPRALRALRGESPLLARPVLRLPDGRRVRLVDIAPRDGSLLLTWRDE
jgi:hypothetical protein